MKSRTHAHAAGQRAVAQMALAAVTVGLAASRHADAHPPLCMTGSPCLHLGRLRGEPWGRGGRGEGKRLPRKDAVACSS